MAAGVWYSARGLAWLYEHFAHEPWMPVGELFATFATVGLVYSLWRLSKYPEEN